MFVSLRTLHAPQISAQDLERLVAELQAWGPRLPGVKTCWVAPVSPTAVINAGQVVWRMTFGSETEALLAPATRAWREHIAPRLAPLQVMGVGYQMVECKVRRTGPGIWRGLVFRVEPHAPADLVRRLEAATLMLPKYVQEIRSWALSPVACSEGTKAFSYVWEQEFDSVADLTGPYMTNPVHWGIVDGFFDAEYPEYIVDPQLVQVVGAIDQSILTPIGPALEAAR
jgi:hypothetical protein